MEENTSVVSMTVRADGRQLNAIVKEGSSLLEAIQATGLSFSAPCGGNGSCGKCQVLVHTAQGLEYLLACRTEVSDGLIIELAYKGTMNIEEQGTKLKHWQIDTNASGLGVAVDVGTTTVACRLIDLSDGATLATQAAINPQVVYGADVISRIDVSKAGRLHMMEEAILETLNQLIASLCAEAKRAVKDIRQLSVAGNTVMEHILCGMSPDSIGAAPFTPLSLFGDEHNLGELPAKAFIAPCVAGYVGGDITAGILAVLMHQAKAPELFIDLGTNGELALGDRHSITTCATAAGPVFEGANIRFGMPALPGAISAVRSDATAGASAGTGTAAGAGAPPKQALPKLEIIGDTKPVGICGTGLVDLAAFMLDNEIVDETGMIVDAEELPEVFASALKELDGQKAFYPLPGSNICVTQGDIRNLQLGKGAVAAGIAVLLEDAGLSACDLSALKIAGGFGRKLNLASAARVGLFPPELLKVAQAVGNTSIEGAEAALLSTSARSELLAIAKQCRYIELSTSLSFNTYFMEKMMF